MSDDNVAVAEATTKAKKPAAEVTKVTMTDGRVVDFAGKRKMLKTAEANGESASLRIDFLNGETRSIVLPTSDALFTKFAAHGMSQKVGDEAAGEETVDDMVVSIDAILTRLAAGEWGTERKVGDGFSGASVVIKAIVEATGKDVAFVKDFLEKKLAAGKEGGLTRQKLYASFKVPGTKTAGIIERLEKEKAAVKPAIDADGALGEMMA